ncbi:patatin-like phospholipase family protein [Aureitalea marina]|uniref:PNPLA domain-containing protein n=1 Tax=Aureitalea marina TaxID=930804 RepID=A0A2S7KQ09_9FLAO|nr:patatin-like phospholipase family protein [Aureitalea marina]PQB04668.1 hypothetical protein BST85_06995 [Aureitalea marina]
MNKTLGIAFAGGGVKVTFSMGFVEVLQRHGIQATHVSGTSAGAMASAFYALGYPAKEVLEIFKGIKIYSLSSITWTKAGMLDMESVAKDFEPHFSGKNFETLPIKVSVVTTNLIEGRAQIFDSGPMVKPLLASCAFPGVFSPVEIDGVLFADGGIINNFPVEQVEPHVDKTLGLYVSPLRAMGKDDFKNTFTVLDRIYRISNRADSMEKFKDCDWLVNPEELIDYGTFSMSSMDELYELGKRYGEQQIDDIVAGLAE